MNGPNQDFALNQVTTHLILRDPKLRGALLPVGTTPSTLTHDYVLLDGQEVEVDTRREVLAYVGTNEGFYSSGVPYQGWLYLVKQERTCTAHDLAEALREALRLTQKYFTA